MKRCWIFPCLLLCLAWLFPLSAAASTPADYRVINMIDDFLAYYDAVHEKSDREKSTAWEDMLENKYPQFFRDAIYRRKTGADRDRYKESCIARFWREIAPEIEAIAALNQGVNDRVHRVVNDFRGHFPGFKPRTDFYITISFSFRGKAVTVGGKDVLAIGLESFLDSPETQLEITLAHELFHLYHFQFFSAGGGLYRTLWAEGLAVYASAMVVPGHRRSTYLGFPVEKMNRCHELLPQLAADLRKNLGRNDHRLKRIYFGAEPNNTRVPPEAGYYVGLLVVEDLARKITLDRLARLPAKEVFSLLEQALTDLEKVRS